MDYSCAKSAEVLEFWFGQDVDDPARLKPLYERWFSSDPVFDEEVRVRFGATVAAAAAGNLSHWCASPRGTLALIIALDQFTRNIYRGQAEAFACDPIALDICRNGIRKGTDHRLAPIERVFFYLPLEHAEDPDAQRESVAAFGKLLEDCAADFTELARKNFEFAVEHLQLIEKFGRFPHRNAVLDRKSTTAELAYLETATNRFGQG